MTAETLLGQLREKGVELKMGDGDRLVIDAPRGTVTEELRAALVAHKAELLQLIEREQKPSRPVTPVSEPQIPFRVPQTPVTAPAPKPAVFEAPVANLNEVETLDPRLTEPAIPLSLAKTRVTAPEPITAVFEAPVANIPTRAEKLDPKPAEAAISRSDAEEIAQLEVELMRMRTEEEARRAEVEAARLATENSLRIEQERWNQTEQELARRRAQQEKQRIEAEAREHAAEEQRRQIAEQEISDAEAQVARMRAMEESRRAEVDKQMRAARESHESGLQTLRTMEAEQASRRAEEERRYLESEARKRAQEEEVRRRAEMSFRAVEEQIEHVNSREGARLKAAEEARRLAEDAVRRRAEEETRRQAEEEVRRRAEEEARLRAEIEAQVRAEAEVRRKAEEEARRRAEEEARRRAQEEAERLAAEQVRRQAEEEARRRAEEEARKRFEEAERLRAEDEARRQAEEQARLQAEEEARQKAEAEVRRRTELEARIRSEVEAKIRAEEAERHKAEEQARRRAEHERILAEEEAKARPQTQSRFELEGPDAELPAFVEEVPGTLSPITEITEWFDLERESLAAPAERVAAVTSESPFVSIHDDADGEFQPVSLPEPLPDGPNVSAGMLNRLQSNKPAERAAAVSELPRIGGEDAFRRISSAFDDQSVEVRSAAARALFDFQDDRAAAFTRALRESGPERRRKVGNAIASSGLANEAIRNLTGESRDKTYDAFSLLFLMSKAGEVQPLMRAIEEHPNVDVRLAVIKLLALSGQSEILPAFRRMAVRGSLPPEVRSAVMEAIYQIASQAPSEAQSTM
jgi:TubC N-terminal docking domain/HEAT repeats